MKREYWLEVNGENTPHEEAMIAYLIDEGVLVPGCGKSNEGKPVMCLVVFCSDVFAWGCSDCEEITLDEIPDLFELCQEGKDIGCGAIQWVCKKRNQQPQAPMVKHMKERGGWTEELEKLPLNQYDMIRLHQG